MGVEIKQDIETADRKRLIELLESVVVELRVNDHYSIERQRKAIECIARLKDKKDKDDSGQMDIARAFLFDLAAREELNYLPKE